MALEAVVYPQDSFSYACKDFYSLLGGGGAYHDFSFQDDHQEKQQLLGLILDNNNNKDQSLFHANWDHSSRMQQQQQHANDHHHPNYSSPEIYTGADQSLSGGSFPSLMEPLATGGGSTRRKRRRTKSSKNKEEIENQRMTHIAVERNRRKQMNEYLAVLRSLMPSSYAQRGDQASIIGGSINYVKELEQLLQSMEAHKRTTTQPSSDHNCFSTTTPFADFFTFPQYSATATHCNNNTSMPNDSTNVITENHSIADIEVNMVESHASLKILTKKQPRQLLKMVARFQHLHLSILHLNVSTVEQMVLYSVSVKVEEGCQLNTVDEIAAAVNQMLLKIEEESAFS